MDIQTSRVSRQTMPLPRQAGPSDGPVAGTGQLDAEVSPAKQAVATGSLGLDSRSASASQAGNLSDLIAGNPQAIQDLQQLEASGKLTPAVKAALDKLAIQPLAVGIDRGELVSTALRNLADPTSITQGDRETCAAAVVQISLAKENPAEYLKLVGGLASPEGKATLSNGATIERDSNWNAASGRSVVDNLMQPSFMRYAAEDYDSVSDSRATANGSGKGLYADEQDKLANAVLGKSSVSVFGSGPEVMNQLSAATGDGQSVSAILKVTDPETGKVKGHSVLVENVQDGKVTYVDPHEGRKTVSLAEFQAQLQSVSLPKKYVTPSLKQATMSDRGLLAGGFFRRLTRAISKVAKAVTKVVHKVGSLVMKPFVMLEDALGIQGPAHAMQKGMDTMYKIANKLIDKAEELTNKIGAALKKAWDKYGSYVMMALQVVCYVVPGLQAVGVALTYAQLAMAAQQAYQGIKTGNWKMAAMGVVSAVAAGAGGIVAAGAKTFGAAAVATAQTVSKVATVAQKVVGAVDAIKNKNYGALATIALSTVKGVAGAVGAGAESAAVKIAEIGEKALAYGQKAQAVYTAFKSGDKAGAAASALSLFGLANKDAGGSEQVSDIASKAANYVSAADKIYDAAKSKDYAGAANAALGLTGAAAADFGSEGLSEIAAKASTYVSAADNVYQAAKNKDYAAAANAALGLTGELGADLGSEGLSDIAAKASNYVSAADKIYDAAKNKDYGAAVNAALGLTGAAADDLGAGADTKAALDKAGQFVNRYGGDATQIAQALQQGDKNAALDLGLGMAAKGAIDAGIDPAYVQQAQGLVSGAQALKKTLDSKDYLGAAMAVNKMAVDAKVLDTAQGDSAEKWLTRASELENAQKSGDYQAMAKVAGQTAVDLGVASQGQVDKLAPKLDKGLELYKAAQDGDKAAAAKLGLALVGGAMVATGAVSKETIQKGQALAKKFNPLQEAIKNKDYAGAAEVAARLGFEAGVLSTEQVDTLAKGTTVAKAGLAAKDAVEKVLERPAALTQASPEQLAKARADFSQLQAALGTGDTSSLAEAAARFAASIETLTA